MLQAYSSLLLTLFFGGFVVWGWLIWRLVKGEPILPRESRRPVPWSLVDLCLTFVLYIVVSIAAVSIVKPVSEQFASVDNEAVEEFEPNLPTDETERSLPMWKTMIALDTGVKALVAGLMLAFIVLRYGASLADFGLSVQHLANDVRIGVITFLGMYLPMIALQAALVYGLEWKYDHPLIESVTESKDVMLFALAIIATSVSAPLIEEFAFRGLLQGWLEKCCSGRSTYAELVTGEQNFSAQELAAQRRPEKEPLAENPNAPPVPTEETEAAVEPRDQVPPTRRDWLAIVASTIVFSLLHYSHGPAWIPLLIFGAATGFVYQRTHRIVPGIVAHFLLNTTTMFGLWIQVFGPKLPE
ncbi:CPBP family intramembrane glutamic endopeptidase [Anatilimnocola floriformis]|uniref:CPBP family intramembrane glutamic endopeptidase n=1 Tax=Anatilimnocola floriformis TaxID=2948575 RepID=UPI0020C3DFC1|nr:CPBP family intramembrane glutamic endopeptidase [Anatilimnocola floriformis]